jgi:hypothetical protein
MLTLLANRRRAPLARLTRAEDSAARAAEALIRYRDNDRIIEVIGDKGYIAGLLVRHNSLADANLSVANARAQLGIHALPPAAEVRRAFPHMSIEEQRELLAKVIDCIFIGPGRGLPRVRTIICPVGTAPRPLPRQGDKGRVMRTIEPRRGWMNPDGCAI